MPRARATASRGPHILLIQFISIHFYGQHTQGEAAERMHIPTGNRRAGPGNGVIISMNSYACL